MDKDTFSGISYPVGCFHSIRLPEDNRPHRRGTVVPESEAKVGYGKTGLCYG